MGSINLEPCPFCGSSASMRHGSRFSHWVQCDKCGAGHPFAFDDEAEAAAEWNRRADGRTSDALEDAVRIMRAAQKEYFRTRASSALTAAKQAERAVDAMLANIDEDKDNAGKPRQGELL